MQDNKRILTYCSNFEKIINADFIEGDTLSLQLVKIYKDFIFKANLETDIPNIIEIDKIMGRYVDDYAFRKTLKNELLNVKVKKTASDIVRLIVENIIAIFKKYELESTRKIYISKWI